jgi:GT2 family glycosyltransferase
MEPRVRVVVVAYRSRGHLEVCLGALPAAADGVPFEVVIVDNASGDGAPEVLRERFPGAALILNDENRGFAAAVNQGARGASAEALLLLNPDASIAPGGLRRLLEALDGDATVGAVGPRLVGTDRRPQASAWPEPGLATLAFEALMLYNFFPRSPWHTLASDVARDVPCLSGACLLVRRSCFEGQGGLDEGFFLYHEDFDFCLRARAAGWRVRLVPEALAVHSLGGSAFQDRGEFFRRFHESRARLLKKHHPGLGGAVLRAVHAAGLALRVVAHALAGLLLGRPALRGQAAHEAAALRAVVASRSGAR